MSIEQVTGGDTAKLRDLLESNKNVVFDVDPAFSYQINNPISVSRVGDKRGRLNGARLDVSQSTMGAFRYIGHPQGHEGKGRTILTGGRIWGAVSQHNAIGLDLRNPNFIYFEDFEFHNIRTGVRMRNEVSDSWAEHNTFRDFRMVNCATGWHLNRYKGNPSMRGTIIEGQNTIWGSVRPFVAEGVDIYSSKIEISMWAKSNTGTASLCLDGVGIRGTQILLNHEDPADIGVYLEGSDCDRGEIRMHFSHDCKAYGMLAKGTPTPVTRVTYDEGVNKQPRNPWQQ